jgi:ABC-type branched-subunit amino acid transport system substrate-binding protein
MSALNDRPKWVGEQQQISVGDQASATSDDAALSSAIVHQDAWKISELASWDEPSETLSSEVRNVLRDRLAWFLILPVVAMLAVFATKPIWELPLLDAYSLTLQAPKPSDRLTVNGATPNSSVVADLNGTAPAPAGATKTAPNLEVESSIGVTKTTVGSEVGSSTGAISNTAGAEPTAIAQAQQSPPPEISRPVAEEPRTVSNPVRGVTDSEIRFGISAPFSGAAKELGQNMQRGIEAAFRVANANGGVHGRQLRLIAADDGYEPARTAETMKKLFEKDEVFGVIGNVGTPTAVVAVPYALQRKMLFFGAFTGAGLLRKDPPDRYVFNYRASYAEETAAVVYYLVKVKRLKMTQIAVFAQQDSYGDAGFAGVAKAIRSLGGDDNEILRLNYQRNTVDVDDAVAQLQAHNFNRRRTPIKAVIMVPTYRAAAAFIKQTRDRNPNMIYTSVSFVGSTALANELMLLGKRYATGVIVTQVVPELDGYSTLVLNYKSSLAKYFPGEAPDYVSLEGYVAANVLIAALNRNGSQLDTERLVETLENLRDLNVGLGMPVTFSQSEHQGMHKVWGTQLDETGHYQPIDLQ